MILGNHIGPRLIVIGAGVGILGLSLWALFIGFDIFRVWRNSATPTSRESPIVVLGDTVEGTEVGLHFRQRLDRAASLAHSSSPPFILITGGGDPSEASVGKRYLVDQGVSPELILMEDQSCSTAENLTNSAQLLLSYPSQRPIILITNGFHLRRAIHLAQENGLRVRGLPAEIVPPSLVAVWPNVVREVAATILHGVWASPGRC